MSARPACDPDAYQGQLRVWWFLLATGMSLGLCAAFLLVVGQAILRGAWVWAIAWGAICALCMNLLVSHVRLAWAARRRGCVLRVDREGINHCTLATVHWEQVRGLALESRTVKYSTQWFLAVRLERAAAARMLPSRAQRLLGWHLPEPHARQHEFWIALGPIAGAAGHPQAVLATVRGIGARVGALVDSRHWSAALAPRGAGKGFAAGTLARREERA